jgi:hypothetical protein
MRNERQNAINRLREQQARSPYFDTWERDFDRTAKRGMRAFGAVWLGILVVNLVVLGVVVWAIIELVQWLTSK